MTCILFIYCLFKVLVDNNGLNITELEKKLSSGKTRFKKNKPFCAGVFLTPCYHNPTGACLSPGR